MAPSRRATRPGGCPAMKYSEGADLDPSGVQDRRGGGMGGGRGLAVGGGGLGLVGVLVLVLFQVLGGGGDGGTGTALGQLSGLGEGQTADNTQLEQQCRTGADANESVDCAVVADIKSIQDYWSGVLGPEYRPTDTVFFNGGVRPDRKSTRLNSSHANISYAVFCLEKKKHEL